MPKAIGQFTIYDFHDVYSSSIAPTNPTKDMIWLDTSLNPPVLKVYTDNGWEIANEYVYSGRNLMSNSKTTETVSDFTGRTNHTMFYRKVTLTPDIKAGDKLSISLTYKYKNIVLVTGQENNARLYVQGSGDVTNWTPGFNPSPNVIPLIKLGSEEELSYYQTYSFILNSTQATNKSFNVGIRTDYIESGSLSLYEMKVEKGEVTGWTPAPEDTDEIVKTHTTQLNTQQGKIDALIQDTTIVKDGVTTKLKDEYNKTVDTVNAHTETLGVHSSNIDSLTGNIKEVDTKVNETKKTVEETKSTISETNTKVGELEKSISSQETSISQMKNEISLKVEGKDVQEAIRSANLSRADFIARNFLTTPLIVTDTTLAIYEKSGIPNPPLGAVFNGYRQEEQEIKDDSVSSNGNAWAIIIGYEFFNNTTDKDKKNKVKDIIKKIANFMSTNVSIGRFNSMDFKFIDTNYKFNESSKTWTKSNYKEIYISTIWLQVKAMMYAYEILEEETYLNLGLEILDSLFNTHFYINNKVKSGELPDFLEWSSYEFLACDNLTSNPRFSASTKQYANQTGYYIHQAIKEVIRVVGDKERATAKGDKYKPSDILTGLKKYLKNAYETQKITALPLGLPYGYFYRVTNNDGTYSYIPQNWDFIENTWGDSWFVGDVVTYTIYSFAASGLTDIAREYANNYYNLRVKIKGTKWENRFSNNELLFYDRMDFNTGSHLEDDDSISITYTALFYDILKEIGMNEYIDSCCYTLAKHQINKLSDKNIDGGYPWDVSKDNASLEFKSLGEIINSQFYKNLNITNFDNIENVIDEVGKIANAAKEAIGDYTSDSILDEAEKVSIRTHLANLKSEKVNIDKEYLTLYSDSDLTGTAKTNLKNAYDNFSSQYTNLTSKIYLLLNSTTVTDTLRNNLNSAFTTHDNYLSIYSQRVNEAITAISEKKKQDSIATSTDYYNAQIVLDKNSILSTVSKSYSTKTELSDLDSKLEQRADSIDLSIQELSADVYDIIENGDFANLSTTNWKTSNMNKSSPVTYNSKRWLRVYNNAASITEEAICSYEFTLKRAITYTFAATVAKYSSSNAFYRITVDGYNKNTNLWSTIKTWTGNAGTTASPTPLTYSYTYSTSSNYSKFRIAIKRLTSDSPTDIYITNVSVTSSNSLVKNSQIKMLSDKIESKVESSDLGTLIQQNAYSVKIAWNNNSKYVQFESGGLAIYNGAVSESQKRAFFDERGNHFWRDGYYLGKIGTNQYTGDTSIKGINFDLEYAGGYMTWAVKKYSSASTYTMMWTYANKTTGSYTLGRLHAGADIDMHNYYLRNVNFEGGGINGTLVFTQIVEMNSNGAAARWYNNSKLVFQNGILIDGTWGNV